MTTKQGYIVLMGSGELTATMVEVHKDLLARLADKPKAVFLDTPAGFQLNIDQISQKAVEYFTTRVQHPLTIASFKSAESISTYEAEQAYTTLNNADYILVGPGSPTYAIRQWQETPIPAIIKRRVESGGCFVAASAAALTVGCLTLPVYEVYKVGGDLSWALGTNILAHFGFDLVVIPHWNNAEGGTHDTRFCYMGEPRFRQLEAKVPENISILGLDEHTACILDLHNHMAEVRGIGSVCIRQQGREVSFSSGEKFSLDVLKNPTNSFLKISSEKENKILPQEAAKEDAPFWESIHTVEREFYSGIETNDPNKIINAILEFDKILWVEQENLESAEFISQAREKFREMIVHLRSPLTKAKKTEHCFIRLVDEIVSLRTEYREKKQWQGADTIRKRLEHAGILVDDNPDGTAFWKRKD